jgi:hypothetical protein
MEQGDLFEQAMKRPRRYNTMTDREKWLTDKDLGILDWDGSCPHSQGFPCNECEKRYLER